jgi:glutamyl-tRNA reductase
LLATLAVTLAACSQTIEERMAKAAERINAEKPRNVESARAEGEKLIVRLAMPPSRPTNDEIAQMAGAGLCSLDEVRAIVKQGGSFRVEVASGFLLSSADVDHCPDA